MRNLRRRPWLTDGRRQRRPTDAPRRREIRPARSEDGGRERLDREPVGRLPRSCHGGGQRVFRSFSDEALPHTRKPRGLGRRDPCRHGTCGEHGAAELCPRTSDADPRRPGGCGSVRVAIFGLEGELRFGLTQQQARRRAQAGAWRPRAARCTRCDRGRGAGRRDPGDHARDQPRRDDCAQRARRAQGPQRPHRQRAPKRTGRERAYGGFAARGAHPVRCSRGRRPDRAWRRQPSAHASPHGPSRHRARRRHGRGGRRPRRIRPPGSRRSASVRATHPPTSRPTQTSTVRRGTSWPASRSTTA